MGKTTQLSPVGKAILLSILPVGARPGPEDCAQLDLAVVATDYVQSDVHFPLQASITDKIASYCDHRRGRGIRKPETLAGISERNRLCREMLAVFYAPLSDREAARAIRRELCRYREGNWRRDRSDIVCPARHRGRPAEYCFAILKAHDAIPSDKTIRDAIAVSHIRCPAKPSE